MQLTNATVMLYIEGTLHSKLSVDFLVGLRVCIFGENFYNKNDLD